MWNKRSYSILLFALRYLQANIDDFDYSYIEDELNFDSDGNSIDLEPVTENEIDNLCEELNCGSYILTTQELNKLNLSGTLFSINRHNNQVFVVKEKLDDNGKYYAQEFGSISGEVFTIDEIISGIGAIA